MWSIPGEVDASGGFGSWPARFVSTYDPGAPVALTTPPRRCCRRHTRSRRPMSEQSCTDQGPEVCAAGRDRHDPARTGRARHSEHLPPAGAVTAAPTAFVANNLSGTVSAIDTATNTVVGTITVGTRPTEIAITPDGTTAYVANFTSGTVSAIETATDTVVHTIAVGTPTSRYRLHPGRHDRLRCQLRGRHGERDRHRHQYRHCHDRGGQQSLRHCHHPRTARPPM